MPANIVFPRAIKFREDKDVGYIGRLVNGIINISRLSGFSLSLPIFRGSAQLRLRVQDTLTDNLCEIVKPSFTTSYLLNLKDPDEGVSRVYN